MMTNESKQYQRVILLAGALVVSLVLNLFLVGIVVGLMPRDTSSKHFALMSLASQNGEYISEWLERYLTPADASAFQTAIKSQADALKQTHKQVRDAALNVAAIYDQDSPDPAALQKALDQVKQAKADALDVAGKIILDSYAKLSPDGRHRLVDITR